MKKWTWLAIACVLTAPVTVADAAVDSGSVQLLPSPLVLPKRIGPMMLTGDPHPYADPSLGVSYQFAGPGFSLTVYVYNAGSSDVPDGADTKPVCEEFEIAKQGVMQAYQNTQLKSEQLVRLNPPDSLPLAREAVYEYEREAHPTISIVWITAAANHFVKLRFSVDPSLRDELPEARRALLSLVGDAIKPHMKPVNRNAAPGTSLSLGLGGVSDDLMDAGIQYLMLLNVAADQSPAQVPVCGGDFVPSLETELGVFRGMLSFGEDLARSKFGKRIAQIDKAGFLEEFLWVDRHRQAWGSAPPDGLNIAEYETWRKKRLKGFEAPAFGSVTIDRPRPLPLEPLTP